GRISDCIDIGVCKTGNAKPVSDPGKVRPTEVSRPKINALQIGLLKIYVEQVRLPKVRACKVCSRKPCASEIRLHKHRVGQICLREVHTCKLCLPKICF